MTMLDDHTNDHAHETNPGAPILGHREIVRREGMRLRRRNDKWMTAFMLIVAAFSWYIAYRILRTGDVGGAIVCAAFSIGLTVCSLGMLWQATMVRQP
jgi:CHASE2 domain-containing sensor protein